MPPTLEKLKGILLSACPCVGASVRPSVTKFIDTVLKFHIWIPHQKIIDMYCFEVWIIPLCGVMPLLKCHNEIL